LDIISNQGIFIKGNGSDIQDKFVSRIVIRSSDEVDQLVWIENICYGTSFSINAFCGQDNSSRRIYLINSEVCFDSDGKPVDGKQAEEVSELLGFIGKSLSKDLTKL